MAWNEAQQTAKPIVEAIQKFDESSSSLSRKMITLSRRIYWLTWIIAILTAAMMFLTAWLAFVAKPSFNKGFPVQAEKETHSKQPAH